MLYQELHKEKHRIEHNLALIQASLKSYPDENFFYTKNGKYQKWYQTDGKNQTYIHKDDAQLAQQLVAKKYLTCLYEDLSYEHKGIMRHLKHHNSHPGKVEKFLSDSVNRHLLSDTLYPKSANFDEWMNLPYEHNPWYPEQLKIDTNAGFKVRSKSEALIVSVLTMYNIPFRYECALQLGNLTIYPDFTIPHPHTHEILYYEHFGKMDEPNYRQKACSKLKTYISHGIIPSIHLLTTFETLEHPLSIRDVEELIKKHFL